jgi:hypothetical protein
MRYRRRLKPSGAKRLHSSVRSLGRLSPIHPALRPPSQTSPLRFIDLLDVLAQVVNGFLEPLLHFLGVV